MDSAWDPDVGDTARYLEQQADSVRPAMISDKWVDTRVPHTCRDCRIEHPRDERMRHQVYRCEGELRSEYICLQCDGADFRGSPTLESGPDLPTDRYA
jgi:hypothetical protein